MRKLASEIDGVDLSDNKVGDIIDLPPGEARLLVAEGWAIAERRLGGFPRVLAFRRDTDLGHHDDEDVPSCAP